MSSKKLEYSTGAWTYCTTHDVRVPFCLPEFSSTKITSKKFHVDNNEVKASIVYDTIIGHELMLQIGLLEYFKHQVLQWDGATVPMK